MARCAARRGLHLKRIGKQNDRTVAGTTCACGAPATALVMTYALCAAHPHLLLAAVRGPHVLHLDEVHHLRNGSTDRAWVAPLVAASMFTKRGSAIQPHRNGQTPRPSRGFTPRTRLVTSVIRCRRGGSMSAVTGRLLLREGRSLLPPWYSSVSTATQSGGTKTPKTASAWRQEAHLRRSREESSTKGASDALNSKGNWLKDVIAAALAKRAELALEHPDAGAIGIGRDIEPCGGVRGRLGCPGVASGLRLHQRRHDKGSPPRERLAG